MALLLGLLVTIGVLVCMSYGVFQTSRIELLVGRAYRVHFVFVLVSIFSCQTGAWTAMHLRFVAVVELWWMAIEGAGSMYCIRA